MIGLLIGKPYEVLTRARIKEKTKLKINQLPNLKTIAITGSAGKTSVKNILVQLLSEKSLTTPHSYNTPLGISKVVDYELSQQYSYFICEMGAYKRGEIKELCEMIPPDIGILTTINEQHLARFGSIENTIKAKFEILENLKPNGVGIINLDNKLIRNNLKGLKSDLIGYTLENNTSKRCNKIIKIINYNTRNNITSFVVSYSGTTIKMETKLLGKHHLSNLLAAMAASIVCGENLNEVSSKVAKINQILHRLELIVRNGVNILDDTYSSNYEGFLEALNVLNSFNGKKTLVTPGIVELGKECTFAHRDSCQGRIFNT